MSDGLPGKKLTRRGVLLGAATGMSAAAVNALGQSGDDGHLYGGKMALSEAYNVAGDLWIGPDSAKSTVSGDSGRVYMASDTQVEYYGDAGSWVKKGIGSSSEPVPSVTTEELNNVHRVQADADGSTIQSVIDSASRGDTIMLPTPEGGTFDLTSPLVIDSALTMKAAGVVSDGDFTDPVGCVLRQMTGGANIIEIGVEMAAVNLENLGLTWESSIANSNTGHGIYAEPPEDPNYTGGYKRGLQNPYWENINVDGHDGDHYAAFVINPQFLEANKFKCKGGGGIRLDQRHGTINHGNSTIIDFFCMLTNEGTAHGIHHYAEDVGGPVSAMNLNTYFRPQVNTSLGSDMGQHVLKKEEVNGGTVMKNGYYGADFEAHNGNSHLDEPSDGGSQFLPALVDTDISTTGSARIVSYGSTEVRKKLIKSQFLETTKAPVAGNNGFYQAIAGSVTGPVTVNLEGSVAGSDYAVNLNADWQTTYTVANKTSSSFDVTFGTATPSGGGIVQGWVMRGVPQA